MLLEPTSTIQGESKREKWKRERRERKRVQSDSSNKGGNIQMRLLLPVIGLALVACSIYSSVAVSTKLNEPVLSSSRSLETQSSVTNATKRTLVVYSGPSSATEPKLELYHKNTEYFINNGGIVLEGNCNRNGIIHDTLLVVGHEFYSHYHARLQTWKQKAAVSIHCPIEQWNSQVRVVARRPICYDMETARLALYGGLGVNIVEEYHYFVYVNCGLTGPAQDSPLLHSNQSWTEAFTSKLNDKVKLSGLTASMLGIQRRSYPEWHIQSFLYALDPVGAQIVQDAGSAFDCALEPDLGPEGNFQRIVTRYEVGMSQAILKAGYSLAPLLIPPRAEPDCAAIGNDRQKCKLWDLWRKRDLKKMYGGRVPNLTETLFFKTSRLLPPDLVHDFHYTLQETPS